MKKSTIYAVITIILIAILSFFCSSCDENTKQRLEGPARTVVLMDNNGDTIKVWKGNFHIHPTENGFVYFYIDGKKTIINGGILISEYE